MADRVALLAAPVSMRDTAEYFVVYKLVEDRHPDQRIVADAELWSTAREFHQTYKKRLSTFVISDFYILTAPDGTVGRGIFDLWRYLRERQQSKTTAFFSTGGKDSYIEEIENCKLAVIGKDTARFAVPKAGVSSVPK